MERVTFPVVFIALLLAPFFSTSAQTISGGFPAQSIWLSKTNAVEGDRIEIFTVLHNGSEVEIRGMLIFSVDGAKIATKEFELESGNNKFESTLWSSKAGKHKISASVAEAFDNSGKQIILSNQDTGEIEINVANPPPPTAIEKTVSVVGGVATNVASTAFPIISSVTNNIYQATESFRMGGFNFAKETLADSSGGIENVPQVLGATSSKSNAAQTNKGAVGENKPSFFSKLAQLASPAILFSFGSRAIFYPLLIILALGLLYILGRMINRPKY